MRSDWSSEVYSSDLKSDRGSIEITIPETGTVEEFAQRLRSELEGLGYEEQEIDEEDNEDED